MIVLADTSGILAAYDQNAPEADGCTAVLSGAGLVVISPLVLAEIDHVATQRLGRDAAFTIVDDIQRWAGTARVVIAAITTELLGAAQALRRRHAALDLDLADAVTMVLAARYRTDAVLTVGRRDFRAVRPLSHHPAFRLLPDDLDPDNGR